MKIKVLADKKILLIVAEFHQVSYTKLYTIARGKEPVCRICLDRLVIDGSNLVD